MAGAHFRRYVAGMNTPTPDEPTPPPYVPPPSEAPAKEILLLPLRAPLGWLHSGWGDVRTAPLISLFFGAAFWGMARVLSAVFHQQPEYTMTIISGCLLLGPFLAMGLYEVSRRHDAGLPQSWVASLTCWKSHLRSMGLLVGVLIVVELLWGRASLVVIALFFSTGLPSSASIMQSVANPDSWQFVVAYFAVGGVFATLVFVMSVVSITMILYRDTDAISAAITSIAVVLTNPGAMFFWGALIALSTALALWLPWSVGLLLVGPVLGHASWHAYRSTVRWL
jgi:uncharacterized membrane protein